MPQAISLRAFGAFLPMDLLSEIIANKRPRIEAARRFVSLEKARANANQARLGSRPHTFAGALDDESKINIIAEFKRRSPSKGEIRRDADPAVTARAYESAGAAAVSVLTEEDYFGGWLDDLRAARKAISLPILRKDFIFDDYQVYESAAAGADAMLLIVAALDDEALGRLRRIIEDELGMDALVEVHTADEMTRADACGAKIIGVNNRDLRTFRVSLETSVQLAPLAPKGAMLISESGIASAGDIRRLRSIGYRAFLIGESLMRADDPGVALRAFLDLGA
jgi:indole-3-glycerol phosphate synthase